MEKETTEYLKAVDVKMNELVKMFEKHDKLKTLLVVCTDDTEDGRTAMVAGLRGNHGNLLQSLLHLMQDENYYPLFKEAMAIHELQNGTWGNKNKQEKE